MGEPALNTQLTTYEWRDKIKADPGFFGSECLNFEATPQQQELFDAIANNNMVAIRSGKGPGKTAAASVVILWWLATHKNCLVICTATKEAQLKKQLWREVRKRLLNATPTIQAMFVVDQLRIYAKGNPEGCQALGQVAAIGNEEAMQGWHDENLLIVSDESSGIPDTHLEALEGTLTEENNKMLMIGNPTKPRGFFFEAFHKAKRFWKRLHWSSVDSPRVLKSKIEKMLSRYGKNSPIYQVQVLGNFPSFGSDTLIPYGWALSALERYKLIDADFKGKIIIGVDPGRSSNGDASAFVARLDDHVLAMEQYWEPDSMVMVGKALDFRSRVMAEFPQAEFGGFCVDTIGLGGPIHDRLKEQGEKTYDVNVSLPPVSKGYREEGKIKPANLRAELWLFVREWLNISGRINPEHQLADDIVMELSSPEYYFNSSGEVMLESKDHMKKRGINSPNLADALTLTFYPVASGGGVWTEHI